MEEERRVMGLCPACGVEVDVVPTDGGRPITIEPNPLGNIVLRRVNDSDQARWLNRDEQPTDPLQPRYRAHAMHCTGKATS